VVLWCRNRAQHPRTISNRYVATVGRESAEVVQKAAQNAASSSAPTAEALTARLPKMRFEDMRAENARGGFQKVHRTWHSAVSGIFMPATDLSAQGHDCLNNRTNPQVPVLFFGEGRVEMFIATSGGEISIDWRVSGHRSRISVVVAIPADPVPPNAMVSYEQVNVTVHAASPKDSGQ